MKLSKRILSVLLCVLMLISVFPVTSLAQDYTDYNQITLVNLIPSLGA